MLSPHPGQAHGSLVVCIRTCQRKLTIVQVDKMSLDPEHTLDLNLERPYADKRLNPTYFSYPIL